MAYQTHWLRAGIAIRLATVIAMLWSGMAAAGIDHEVSRDDRGIWARGNQTKLQYGAIAAEIGGALWLGNDDPLGHTFWQAIDSSVVSSIVAEVAKRGFSRARPHQGNDPHAWFKGSCCEGFPSGEVTLQASIVTPFVVDYAREHPWVWALELVPLYDSIARVKSQAHWQTDVIAGWALGSAIGYWSARRDVPLSVELLPHGITVGFSKRF